MNRLAVLVATLALAGCTVEPAVSPLPTEAAASPSATPPRTSRPAAAPSSSPTRSNRPAVSPSASRTTRPPTTPPPSSSSCQGAVVHVIDVAADELALVPALCLGRGAVLRIENIGPGEVTTDAPDLVDPNYEAGIFEIRFLRAGTVVVTILQQGTAHDVTVVVR